MNHMVGRGMVFGTLARGGTAYFTARPDLSTLFEDIRLARPTELLFFPRVLEMIHRHYLGEVVRRTEAGGDVEAVRAQVMEEMRAGFLGDRVSIMTVGSAPTTPEIRRFVEDCFQVTLRDIYASTEAGASVSGDTRIARPPASEYRLRYVPVLGYPTTDKPYPRGELCIKSDFTIPGYF